MTVASTPKQVAHMRLCSIKGMLKLERAGMKSRGGALRPKIAAELGLKPRDSYDTFIAVCEKKIAESLSRMAGQDVDVVARDMLDDAHRANFDLPWLVQHSTGYVVQFGSEDAACTYQREWRASVGLNQMTGEPA